MLRRFSLVTLALTAVAYAAPEVRPAHEYDLVHVKVDLSLDFKAESIAGSVTNTVVTSKANAKVAFDQGPMKIHSVTAGGKALPFKTQGKFLIVDCKGSKAKTKLAITIKYSASPEAGIYFVPEDRSFPGKTALAYTQGEMVDTRYWIPTYDWPDDKTTTELIARVPAGMSVLSNGYLASSKAEQAKGIWHWKMEQPMVTYLISLVAGKYTAIPDGNFKGKPVEIWAPTGSEAMAKQAFQGTDKMIAIYSRLTGFDYPWAKYAQSVVPEFMFGGMENASCTTQTIGAIYPSNSAGSVSAQGLDAHELAHQWFGDTVTCTDWAHAWINEGWATFLPNFITREWQGEGAFHMDRNGTFEGCKWDSSQKTMVRRDYTEPMEMFDGNAYPGGASRMFMLMHLLGEEQFWKATKEYLHAYAFKNVTTEQFFDSYSKSTGRDLSGFKQQWFYTKGFPNYVAKRNGGNVDVTQTLNGWNLPVEYSVVNDNGVVRRGTLEIPGSVAVGAGESLLIDPGAWMLCGWTYGDGYSQADYDRMWRHADNDGTRSRLLWKASPSVLLEAYRAADTNDQMKKTILGRIDDEATLMAASRMSDGGFALAGLQGLGRLQSPSAWERIEQVFSTTSNEAMKNTAYDLLLGHKNDSATAEIGLKTKTYNLGPQQSALRWIARNDAGRAREIALDWLKTAPGPLKLTAVSVLGQVKDREGSKQVLGILMNYARGRSYGIMNAAINALAEYGDKSAIPVLEARKNHSLHFARGTVNGALARLKR